MRALSPHGSESIMTKVMVVDDDEDFTALNKKIIIA
jgi:hypothetical protein